MRALLFDVRDAAAGLRRDAAFAVTVIVTLALTLGASTAMFSIVDGVLLKPLPYSEPDRLVMLHEIWREFAQRAPRLPINERHFEYWRSHGRSFEAMAQYLPVPANLTTPRAATQISVARATSSLFDVLKVQPALGRVLLPSDEPEGQPDVAVISAALWRNHLEADPAFIGKPVMLDGKAFTVVGILPANFRLPVGEQLIGTVDAFIPLRVAVGWVGDHNNLAIAKLRRDTSLDDARAELGVLQAQVSQMATQEAGEPVTLAASSTPLYEAIVGGARRGLLLLFAAIVVILLIACANLMNLTLTRIVARARDAAIRAALGASRGRLIRAVVIEQVLLATIAGVGGLGVAMAGLALFVRTAAFDLPRVEEVTLDGRVWTFMFATATLSGVIVSILPARFLTRRDVQDVLRAGGTVVGADPSGQRSRLALLTIQLAASVTLLVVTGLLTTSLMRVLAVDIGFRADDVVAVPIVLPGTRYADARLRIEVYDRILDGVRAVPGVQSVSPTSLLPMRGEGQVNFIVAAGTDVPRSEQPSANFRFIAPGYFDALRLPLKAGRAIGNHERDRSRPAPAVVSESVASRLWPGQDALGQVFGRGIDGEQAFEVVGVAVDARTTSIERSPPLMVYVPYWWMPRPSTSLLVRTSSTGVAVIPAIRRVVRGIDPEIAIGEPRRLQGLIDDATARRRYQSKLFLVFAGVALFIALVGVYTGTAYSLSKRKREMNIRVALGARTVEVVGLIVRQTGIAVVAGVALGIAAALILGSTLASLLYEVHPRDPFVITGVALLVATAALVAMLTATRRGLSLDPVAALRQE